MSTEIILADSPTGRTSASAGLSNRLLARRLFDNARLQRDGRRRWADLLELLAGELDSPVMVAWRGQQLTGVADQLAQLKREADVIQGDMARRRQTGGAQ